MQTEIIEAVESKIRLIHILAKQITETNNRYNEIDLACQIMDAAEEAFKETEKLTVKRDSEKERCILCEAEVSNIRYAYRGQNHTVTKDGFRPRNNFTWEEIHKMTEGDFNSVCADRAACCDRQLKAQPQEKD